MRRLEMPYTNDLIASVSDAGLERLIQRFQTIVGVQKTMAETEYRCPSQLCKCGSFRVFSPDDGEHLVIRCARCQTIAMVGKFIGAKLATPQPCEDCGLVKEPVHD